uniref:Uncharacterized protein n=1 Tax=Cacopsylla melanoneura TaxID=428564 RepID=A0A8D9BPE6_9HEMI
MNVTPILPGTILYYLWTLARYYSITTWTLARYFQIKLMFSCNILMFSSYIFMDIEPFILHILIILNFQPPASCHYLPMDALIDVVLQPIIALDFILQPIN